MILRRFFTMAALAVVASLTLSDRAHAGYDVSTSVPTASVTGGSSIMTFAPGSTFVITGANGGTVTATYGYTSFVDGGGSTIYLVNSYFSNFIGNPFAAVENVYANYNSSDTSTWSFTDVIKVTNPSASLGGTSTGTFTESASYSMAAGGGTGSAPSLGSPTSIMVGGVTFTIFNPQVTSLTANSVSNNGALSAQITTVPEPASVVMLGGGLAGVVALGLRRRRKLA